MKKALHQSRHVLVAAFSIALAASILPSAVQANELTSQSAKQHNHQLAKVSLNNASVEQLETLKGVGHKKAQAIVKYRQQIGQFVEVEQLLNVKGIGAKIIQDNLARLTI